MPPRKTVAHLQGPISGNLPPRGAEKSLLAAIGRLQQGMPTNPELSDRARTGKLKVNATTVTMEAGCARRLAYAFPRVRKALGIDEDTIDIGVGQAPRPKNKSLQEIVVHLRAEKIDLKRERDEALSKAAALIVRMRNMELDLAKEVRKAERQAKRPEHPNRVTGNVRRLFSADEE